MNNPSLNLLATAFLCVPLMASAIPVVWSATGKLDAVEEGPGVPSAVHSAWCSGSTPARRSPRAAATR